jgi:ADP-ribose pyrophosphatase YjhB (NUDIX family)
VSYWRDLLDGISSVVFHRSAGRDAIRDSEDVAPAPDLIRAAGGVVWRSTLDGWKVAVIHRKRYGDWTLPKGKLRAGESFREAALREVKEETGCDAELRDLAGVIRYTVRGAPKVVLFWHMELVGEGTFRPSEEVEQIEWLLPDEAIGILDYPAERDLLARQRGLPPPRETCARWWSRARRWLGSSLSTSRIRAPWRGLQRDHLAGPDAKAPAHSEQIADSRVTALRPALGAMAALVASGVFLVALGCG